ncbi:MAG: hypothetical protein FWG55_03180 [Candidatus Bathyarchaeota archaeon]|nr:hypothetical protein [Candidatus Termiticorpusculum sp.]
MLNHVKIEIKPINSFIRYFILPFLAISALTFVIIAGKQFSLATSVMFSLGYAWCFSAPLLLTGTRNIRHRQLQTIKTSNSVTKKVGLAASTVAITTFSIWAIQSVISQVSSIVTVYLSIVSVLFVSVFAIYLYFSK